jgi:hypothetical protein
MQSKRAKKTEVWRAKYFRSASLFQPTSSSPPYGSNARTPTPPGSSHGLDARTACSSRVPGTSSYTPSLPRRHGRNARTPTPSGSSHGLDARTACLSRIPGTSSYTPSLPGIHGRNARTSTPSGSLHGLDARTACSSRIPGTSLYTSGLPGIHDARLFISCKFPSVLVSHRG